MHDLRQALKLVLDYYHKEKKFAGGAKEDWLRHLRQIISLADDHESNENIMLNDFHYYVKNTFEAYQYYLKLHRNPEMAWKTLTEAVNEL